MTADTLFAPDLLPLHACRLTEAAAACAFGVAALEIRMAARCRARVAFARQAAIYLARVGFGLASSSVASGFRRDPATVRHACARIEDARDRRNLDCGLTRLELALRHHDRAFACSHGFARSRGDAA